MKIEMNKVLLVLAVAMLSSVYGDWSWGSNGKAIDSAKQETIATASVVSEASEAEGRNSKALHEQFPDEVLPLEEHSSYDNYEDLSADPSIPAETLLDEEGREGRFLGISNKLCKFGVKGMCDNKQQGYPPALPSHYGNSLGSTYGNYAPEVIPFAYEEYPGPYPDVKVGPPKKPFTKIFSDIFNPKKLKGPSKGIGGISPAYGVPQPAYGVPQPAYSVPEPTYGAPKPTYSAPKPSYKPPINAYPPPAKSYGLPPPKPVYAAPQRPYIEPKPVYSAPKPIYKDTFQTYGSPKPTDVLHHKVLPIHTHVVEPTKVQHLHTHTHIYNSPVGSTSQYDIKNANNFPRDDGIYQATSDVKTTVELGTNFESDNTFQSLNNENNFQPFNGETSFQSFNGDKSFQSFNGDNSFQTFNNDKAFQNVQKENFGDSFKPSQSVPFIDGFPTNQDKRHINQATLDSFNTFGAKEQAFQNSINQLTSSFATNGIQRAYPVDCQCVPRQHCTPEDLVARTGSSDIGHLLDARNEKNEVLSNSTNEVTDNTTLPLDYYDYDYLQYAENTAEPSEDVEITTINSNTREENNETSTTEASTTPSTIGTTEAARIKRSLNDTESSNTTTSAEGLSGRQLTGFSPGINGCGHDHVCCRRPVYVAAQRSVPTCGRGNPSIHGRVSSFEFESGQADFGEYPWQAAILREEGSESMFVCGATLIDNLHVLTAAHCVNDLKVNALKVRLGEWDVNRDTEFYKHVEIPVAAVIVHPDFYKGNLYNDIAIVRMADFADIDSSPHIAPVCLPTPNTDFTNYRCHVTGWGKDAFGDKGNFQHILKELEIPVVNRKSCEHSLRSTRLGEDYKLHEGFLCAGGEEGKDACKGDGGGPLVCSAGDKSFQLAGIVSWGVGCGQQGIPGVYVNIPHYVDWIRSSIRF